METCATPSILCPCQDVRKVGEICRILVVRLFCQPLDTLFGPGSGVKSSVLASGNQIVQLTRTRHVDVKRQAGVTILGRTWEMLHLRSIHGERSTT